MEQDKGMEKQLLLQSLQILITNLSSDIAEEDDSAREAQFTDLRKRAKTLQETAGDVATLKTGVEQLRAEYKTLKPDLV